MCGKKGCCALKLVLRDVNNKRFVKKNSEEIIEYVCIYASEVASFPFLPAYLPLSLLFLSSYYDCGTFSGLTAGVHRVRAIASERLSGQGGKTFISEFFYFTISTADW